MPAASNHYATRLVFRSVSVPAESARHRDRVGSARAYVPIVRFCTPTVVAPTPLMTAEGGRPSESGALHK
jgi:hypothetical protein